LVGFYITEKNLLGVFKKEGSKRKEIAIVESKAVRILKL
jgi:hypothetical protein